MWEKHENVRGTSLMSGGKVANSKDFWNCRKVANVLRLAVLSV